MPAALLGASAVAALAGGGWVVSTVLGNGTGASVDGPVATATIETPWGVHADGDRVYWAEFGNRRIQNVTRCDLAGYSCSKEDKEHPECMSAPGRGFKGINSCDCGCDVFWQMSSGHRVRVLHGGVVSTLAGSGIRGLRDGPALDAEFNHPYGVLAVGGGDVLVADAYNHAVRLYDAARGEVRTAAGGRRRGCRDAPTATDAGLNYPTGLAQDPSDAQVVYVADRGNNCIRALDRRTGALRTVAGDCCSGHWGYRDGAAGDALFSGPSTIAAARGTSNATTLYVADGGNDAVRVVTVPAGGGAARVDTLLADMGSDLSLNFPTGLALDDRGGLFVSSYFSGRVLRYRGVAGTTAAALDTVAGDGGYGFADGPGPAATFKGPKGLAWRAGGGGSLLVADFFNQRIRAIAPTDAAPPPRRPATATRRAPAPAPPPAPPAAAAPGAAVSVLVWTGHSGPYHDHFANGRILAAALNASGKAVAVLACTPPGDGCESAFEAPHLRDTYDVILLYADTYENPLRGSLTAAQWDGLFGFVRGGGGLFALHTASACWDNEVEHPGDALSVAFHHDLLNAAFGGHSPYKDYVAKVVDSTNDPITHGLSNYVVTDELYHPLVFNRSRSTIFLTAYDPGQCGPVCENDTAVHGMRHEYGDGRVLYFAQGHDMAEFETPEEFQGNHAFQTMVMRSLLWLAKRI